MQCPKCRSQMFVADENVSSRSHVTFYRCSICIGEHVSSEPVIDNTDQESSLFFAFPGAERIRPQIA